MNRTPAILVDSGFEVDHNGALTEIDIPGTVLTCDPPKKVVFNGTTLSWIPSVGSALQQIVANNVTAINITSSIQSFNNYQLLTSASFASLTSITESNSTFGLFSYCSLLQTVIMPNLTHWYRNGGYGTFRSCTGLKTITLPKMSTIADGASANSGFLSTCTSLETVQLGSDGNPVTSIGANTFIGCTQAGLTITIYTTGGASLSGAPWGATNATIVYEEA